MKVFKARPQSEVRVRKPDDDRDIYEMWHVQPSCLGTVEKLGNRNYRTDDGMIFANLDAAARYMSERAAKDYSQIEEKPYTRPTYTGQDILEAGRWNQFCELKKLDVRQTARLLKREFVLTQQEARDLGLAPR